MNTEAILWTIIASLLSGLVGVFVSYHLYSRLETRKSKIETARKLFANKFNIQGTQFNEALNELMIVFSDSKKVIKEMESFWKVVDTPLEARSKNAADDALINLMKAICTELGIKYKDLPDSYFLRYFKATK